MLMQFENGMKYDAPLVVYTKKKNKKHTPIRYKAHTKRIHVRVALFYFDMDYGLRFVYKNVYIYTYINT